MIKQARLFQEGTGWEMRAIKPIDQGSQIYNTYGNLPNHDLLRRYGYILPGSKDDLVEISSEIIVQCFSNRIAGDEIRRRIDLLDEEEIYEESSPP
jgi:N-lysine methyltransferase SETD6